MLKLALTYAALLLPFWTEPSVAEPFKGAEYLSPEAHSDWQAIGRVNRAGFKSKTLCSGTLIAPEWVLTAAHCVPPGGRDQEFVFVAGWFLDSQAAVRRAKRVLRPEALESLKDDIALIELAEPITDVAPIPLAANALSVGETLAFVGYSGDRPYALSGRFDCVTLPAPENLFLTDCEVIPGNSGAPFLLRTDTGWTVAGVVSARTQRSGGSSIGVQPTNLIREALGQ